MLQSIFFLSIGEGKLDVSVCDREDRDFRVLDTQVRSNCITALGRKNFCSVAAVIVFLEMITGATAVGMTAVMDLKIMAWVIATASCVLVITALVLSMLYRQFTYPEGQVHQEAKQPLKV